MSESSTKPYFLRAIYEWCTDNGYTPYLAVSVDAGTRVPMEFVRNGEIVLNISFSATSGLKMDNDFVNFSARFGGVSRQISVPVANVMAIYANENGQGMAFEVQASGDAVSDTPGLAGKKAASADVTLDAPPQLSSVPSAPIEQATVIPGQGPDDSPDAPKKVGRPVLTRIK
jgi:stringent starvation protein B